MRCPRRLANAGRRCGGRAGTLRGRPAGRQCSHLQEALAAGHKLAILDAYEELGARVHGGGGLSGKLRPGGGGKSGGELSGRRFWVEAPGEQRRPWCADGAAYRCCRVRGTACKATSWEHVRRPPQQRPCLLCPVHQLHPCSPCARRLQQALPTSRLPAGSRASARLAWRCSGRACVLGRAAELGSRVQAGWASLGAASSRCRGCCLCLGLLQRPPLLLSAWGREQQGKGGGQGADASHGADAVRVPLWDGSKPPRPGCPASGVALIFQE